MSRSDAIALHWAGAFQGTIAGAITGICSCIICTIWWYFHGGEFPHLLESTIVPIATFFIAQFIQIALNFKSERQYHDFEAAFLAARKQIEILEDKQKTLLESEKSSMAFMLAESKKIRKKDGDDAAGEFAENFISKVCTDLSEIGYSAATYHLHRAGFSSTLDGVADHMGKAQNLLQLVKTLSPNLDDAQILQNEFDACNRSLNAKMREKWETREVYPMVSESDILNAGEWLACALRGQGNYSDALKIAHEVWERRKSFQPSNQAAILANGQSVAELHCTLKQYQEAEPIAREVWEGRKALLSPDDPITLISQASLIAILCELKHFSEAEAISRATWDKRHLLDPNEQSNSS